MKKMLFILLVLITFITPSAFGEKKVYKIGAFLSLTGPAAPLGTPERDSILMVVDQINRSGGINGHQIEIIIEDDGSEPSNAVKAVRKLIYNDKVCALIGGSTTGTTLAVMSTVASAKIPLISCAAGIDITRPVNEWVFRVAPTDVISVSKLLKYLSSQKITKVAVIYDSNSYGTSGREQIDLQAPRNGIKVVAAEAFNTKDTDMTVQLTKIKDSGAQAIICWGTNPGPSIITKNVNSLGIKIPLFQSHGVADRKFIDLAGKSANGVIFPSSKMLVINELPQNDPQKKVLQSFAKTFRDRYGKNPDHFAGHGWDAISIILNAIKKAGNDPSKIRDQIENTKNFIGIDGIFNFSKTNHDGLDESGLVLVKVVDGNWELFRR